MGRDPKDNPTAVRASSTQRAAFHALLLFSFALLLAPLAGAAVPQCGLVPTDTISYYPADGNFNDVASGLAGTPYNVYFAPGAVGQAFRFPSHAYRSGGGGRVYINIPQVNTASGGTNTVAFWMYWDGTEVEMPFGFYNYNLYLALGRFGLNSGYAEVVGPSNAGLANRWVHVVALMPNGQGGKIFIDGVYAPDISGGGVVAPQVTSSAVISGCGNCASKYPSGKYELGGMIDDFRVWNRALSDSEVAALYRYAGGTS